MKVFISLSDTVKSKIENKFKSDIEDFIEREFPQDKTLNCYFFKYGDTHSQIIGVQTDNSKYMFLIQKTSTSIFKNSYFKAIKITEKVDITYNDNFINIKVKLYISDRPDSINDWKLSQSIKASVLKLNEYQIKPIKPKKNIKTIEQKKSNLNEQIITISLGNRVKEKIQTKFKSNISIPFYTT